MRFWFLSVFVLPLAATVNEPFRWELTSGYRNDTLHWHLLTGGSGALTTSQIYRDVQFWENGLAIRTIYRDLAFCIRGSYGAFGKGSVAQRYGHLPFAYDEPQFKFQTDGWAADTSGYFGYAVNLTPDRTYKAILIPLLGYSAHFLRLRGKHGSPNPWESAKANGATSYTMSASLPGTLHQTWFGVFLGAGFQIEPGDGIVLSGGYSYHLLNTRFKAQYAYDRSLFNPALSNVTGNSYSFEAKGGGNLGQTGWAQIDFLIGLLWRIGFGAQLHYFSTELIETTLEEESVQTFPSGSVSSGSIEQKLKVRWTPISGWFFFSRRF